MNHKSPTIKARLGHWPEPLLEDENENFNSLAVGQEEEQKKDKHYASIRPYKSN